MCVDSCADSSLTQCHLQQHTMLGLSLWVAESCSQCIPWARISDDSSLLPGVVLVPGVNDGHCAAVPGFRWTAIQSCPCSGVLLVLLFEAPNLAQQAQWSPFEGQHLQTRSPTMQRRTHALAHSYKALACFPGTHHCTCPSPLTWSLVLSPTWPWCCG